MNPSILDQIQNTKAAKEMKALDEFFRMLSTDSARAFYGPGRHVRPFNPIDCLQGHVMAAAELNAVETLLISDSIIRIGDINQRARYHQG